MKISYDWLSEYVDLEGVSPQKLADILTMAGLEVDELIIHKPAMDGVVVGHVLTAERHPNADRLSVCTVNIGDETPLHIVCGGPNVAAGQRVPVATIGTVLELPSRDNPDELVPVTIRKGKIRGEVSEGMICSESELGLGPGHEGILVLDDDAVIGQPFEEYLRERGSMKEDATFDVAITPNRPDATSHIGMARDVAAILQRPLKKPNVRVPEAGTSAARIQIDAPKTCARYVGLIVRGVKIGPSPEWLQDRLAAVGLRPINNVVDVTNFVMYEIGQPLHAFDLKQLAGDDQHEAVIIVRETTTQETFTTLDGVERKLPVGALLICDAERPVAVAGVMGGENSEVTDETADLLIESAWFDPVSIRKTSKALSLQTDSSYRFERGVDTQIQSWAAARAAELIAEVAGGTIDPVIVDEHPTPTESLEITVRPERVSAVLGEEIPGDTASDLLRAIEFEVLHEDSGLRVTVPSFRPDVEREIDVIEEIARLYGYDNIPLPGRTVLPSLTPRQDLRLAYKKTAADRLAGLGFQELYTNSLLPEKTAIQFAVPSLTGSSAEAVVTANPINQDMAALRPSLLPGALSVIAYNQNRGAEAIRLFEFGHVFGKADDADALVEGYREREYLLITLSGQATRSSWDQNERDADFFDLKGIVFHLFTALGIKEIEEIVETNDDGLTPYRLILKSSGSRIAALAQTHKSIDKQFDLRKPVFFAEIDWSRLADLLADLPEVRYQPVPKFPTIQRDLAVTVDKTSAAGPLLETIRKSGAPLLRSVEIFDLYQGERIDSGKKSIAFSLSFQAANRTLTDKVIDKQVRQIVSVLENEHNATLRS